MIDDNEEGGGGRTGGGSKCFLSQLLLEVRTDILMRQAKSPARILQISCKFSTVVGEKVSNLSKIVGIFVKAKAVPVLWLCLLRYSCPLLLINSDQLGIF